MQHYCQVDREQKAKTAAAIGNLLKYTHALTLFWQNILRKQVRQLQLRGIFHSLRASQIIKNLGQRLEK